MEKESKVSEQSFTEGKALRHLCSIMWCVKLSFMIKNFEKWTEIMVSNILNLVLERYWKSVENDFKNVWEPWLSLNFYVLLALSSQPSVF